MTAASLVAVVALAAATNAADVGRARKLFEVGARAYQNRNYRVAISAFEAAYKLTRLEQVVFSLAQAHRLQFLVDSDPWKVRRALALYREYLNRFPSGKRRRFAVQHRNTLRPILAELRTRRPNAFVRRAPAPKTQFVLSTLIANAKVTIGAEEITEFPDTLEVEPGEYAVRLEAPGYFPKETVMQMPAGATVPLDVELTPMPAQLRVHAPEGSEILVNGIFQGEAPLGGAIEVAAGSHFVSVVKNGAYPYARDLKVGRGQTIELTASLNSSRQRTTSYVLVAVGGALAVGSSVAFGFALKAQANARDLEEQHSSAWLTEAEREAFDDAKADRDRATVTGFVLGGAAVATGVTAALLYFLDRPRAPTASRALTVGPAFGEGRRGVAISGSF